MNLLAKILANGPRSASRKKKKKIPKPFPRYTSGVTVDGVQLCRFELQRKTPLTVKQKWAKNILKRRRKLAA